MARSLTASPEKRPTAKGTVASNNIARPKYRAVASSKSSSKSSTRPAAKRRRLNADETVDAHRPAGHANGLPLQTNDHVRSPKTSSTKSKISKSNITQNGMPFAAPAYGASRKKGSTSPDDKRSLRSKDNVPPKSDLEKYFPDYQEVFFGEQEDEESLPPETVIHIIPDPPSAHSLPLRMHPSHTPTKRKRSSPPPSSTIRSQKVTSNSLPVQVRGSTRKDRDLDLKPLAAQWSRAADDPSQDPLSDESYQQAHKRAERKEKQSRNTDRERAMHEKSELERLLGDLKGPDWLRTLGISGITETQKRQLEPKRDEFIRRVKALLARFAAWKAKEKKLKEKRDRRLARLQAQEDEEEDEEEEAEDEDEEPEEEADDSDAAEDADALSEGGGDGPPGNAISKTDSRVQRKRPPSPQPTTSSASPEPSYSSFFEKPHLRAAALGNHRRGRHIYAFGHPVPDLDEMDFVLPADMLQG